MTDVSLSECSFSSWYPSFKNITIESVIIPLTHDVVVYLNSDGLVLPTDLCTHTANQSSLKDTDWDDDESVEEAEIPDLSAFIFEVEKAIDKLGGSVFPKLNWSSPKDASWIAFGNTLKCTSANDILLLLKSSTFISHDLIHIDKLSSSTVTVNGKSYHITPELVLRQWSDDINPAAEFRCFVRNNILIDICQRDRRTCYDYIQQNRHKLVEEIKDFYAANIQNKTPGSSYVFDIYRTEKDKFHLLDFGPFGPVTDPLLFTWDELTVSNSDSMFGGDQPILPILRYVSRSNNLLTPSEYRQYSYPVDVACEESLYHFANLTLADLQNTTSNKNTSVITKSVKEDSEN